MPDINIPEIQQKLYEKLKPSGWGQALKGFFISSDMEKILLQLQTESEENRKFTPRLKQVFRFLEECPYDKVKVVMMLQCPYQYMIEDKTVADGIPMSCLNTGKPQPSLSFVHKDIRKTVYHDQLWKAPIDLKLWANQGVLLINAALTTTIGKVDTHLVLWRPFLIYLLDVLTWQKPGLVYVYMGNVAQRHMSLTPDNNYKFTTTHPASAAHNNAEIWESEDIWNKVNQTLEKNNQTKIIW